MRKTNFLFLIILFGAIIAGGCYRYTDGYPNSSFYSSESSILPFSQIYYNNPDYGPYYTPYPYYGYPYPNYYPYPYYSPYPYYLYPYGPYPRFYFGGYYVYPQGGFPSSSPHRTFRSHSSNNPSPNTPAPPKKERRFK